MKTKQLKQLAREIYDISLQFDPGSPRTRYRQMKVEEAEEGDRFLLREYIRQCTPRPVYKQFWIN